MGFEWNLSQRFLHMLGRDALKIFQRNQRHLEIGRSEVQNTFETVESAGTSNPKPPRSFQRGGEPSFKDWRVRDAWKVEIAPRVRERERRRERVASAVKKKWGTVYPDLPRGIYRNILLPGVCSLRVGVSGQSGVSGPWAGDSGSPWDWAKRCSKDLDLYEFGKDRFWRSNGVREITQLEISQQSIKENNDLKWVNWRTKPKVTQFFFESFQDLFILENHLI